MKVSMSVFDRLTNTLTYASRERKEKASIIFRTRNRTNNKNNENMETKSKNIVLPVVESIRQDSLLKSPVNSIASPTISIRHEQVCTGSITSMSTSESQLHTPLHSNRKQGQKDKELNNNKNSENKETSGKNIVLPGVESARQDPPLKTSPLVSRQNEEEQQKVAECRDIYSCNNCNKNRNMEAYRQNIDLTVCNEKTIEECLSLPPDNNDKSAIVLTHLQKNSQTVLSAQSSRSFETRSPPTISKYSNESISAPPTPYQEKIKEELRVKKSINYVGKKGEASVKYIQEEKRQHALIQRQQYRILSLWHAAICTNQENHCPISVDCAAMKKLWRHMAKCCDHNCKVPQCFSSRYILSHYHRCTNSECKVCVPVRNLRKKTVNNTTKRPRTENKDLLRNYLISSNYVQSNISAVSLDSRFGRQSSVKTMTSITEE